MRADLNRFQLETWLVAVMRVDSLMHYYHHLGIRFYSMLFFGRTNSPTNFDRTLFLYKKTPLIIIKDLGRFYDITLLRTNNRPVLPMPFYSTVTDLAKLRGLSTSVPRASAV